MKGREMRQLRQSLRMDRVQFARLIGYTGTNRNDATRVKRYEKSPEPVPLHIARLLWLIGGYVRHNGELPHFPEWGYYDYEHGPDPEHARTIG
jgi:hypothetical protein